MLVLSLWPEGHETQDTGFVLELHGQQVKVRILDAIGKKIKVGIEAPADVQIARNSLLVDGKLPGRNPPAMTAAINAQQFVQRSECGHDLD